MEINLENENKKEVATFNAKDLKVSKLGELEIKNYDDQWRVANMYVQSKMLPKQYDTAEKVLTGMQYARDLGLKGITALRQICVINGSPSIFGDMPLAMARTSGELESIKEFLFDEDVKEISFKNKNLFANFLGAVCIIKRKGSPKATYTFTMADAEQAKLLSKDIWKNYPKTMLKYRARSIALKDQFGDVLGGIAIREYDDNEMQFENNKPVSNEPEVIQERETVTEEKIQALKNMELYFEQLRISKAKQIALIAKLLKCEDPYFATMENIIKLNALLLKEINNGKTKETTGKKDSKKESSSKKIKKDN